MIHSPLHSTQTKKTDTRSVHLVCAAGGTRTLMRLPSTDFKSVAYTSSATTAWWRWGELNPRLANHYSIVLQA